MSSTWVWHYLKPSRLCESCMKHTRRGHHTTLVRQRATSFALQGVLRTHLGKNPGKDRPARGCRLLSDKAGSGASVENAKWSDAANEIEIIVDRFQGGTIRLRGVKPTVQEGTILNDLSTGKPVAYIAYNLKDMDPTEYKAIALSFDSRKSGPPQLQVGQKLGLSDEILRAPKASDVLGKVVDCFGFNQEKAYVHSSHVSSETCIPTFNTYPTVDERQPITENLHTGVKALDMLIPVGRGQSMLIMGKARSHKTGMALDILRTQKQYEEIKCVYACDRGDLERVKKVLESEGISNRTTIVLSDAEATTGSRFTALLNALAIAEDVRDEGGHAVVFLDDLSSVTTFWQEICELENPTADDEMTEVDGMLIGKNDALQRQFFSNILQRSAKLSDMQKGGSLTLFGLIQGEPKREDHMSVGVNLLKHNHLDEKTRGKLLKALADRAPHTPSSRMLSPRLVEEMKSISDGHILVEESELGEHAYEIVPTQSTTRLGVGRIAAPPMMELSCGLQLKIKQGIDARAYGIQESTFNFDLLMTLLRQKVGESVPLDKSVALLYAVMEGYLAHLTLDEVEQLIEGKSSEEAKVALKVEFDKKSKCTIL